MLSSPVAAPVAGNMARREEFMVAVVLCVEEHRVLGSGSKLARSRAVTRWFSWGLCGFVPGLRPGFEIRWSGANPQPLRAGRVLTVADRVRV